MAYQNERLSPRQWIWAWWNLRKLKRIPVYRAALDEVRRLMNDDNFKWWMSKTMRLKFSNRILEGLGVVSQVPNAVLANRELLCNELIECAHYGVLVLPAAPGDDTTGLRGQLGITGELRSHLEEALRESDHFKDRSGNMGQDLEDVGREEFYPLCYVGYLQAQSTICVFDKVRRELNDHIAEPGRDWLWPTATALYAWEEHGHRQPLVPMIYETTSLLRLVLGRGGFDG